MEITHIDHIAVIHLGDGENRFSLTFLDQLNHALDEVLASKAQGLVTTAGEKFYSNGLDVDWLQEHQDRFSWYLHQAHILFSRILTFPLPTAAAIVGHAFGAGAVLALAHDYRLMRAQRGFFCFPEIDVHIPFTAGIAALLREKLTPQIAVESMMTGKRFGGVDAAHAGLVDTAVEGDSSTVTTAAINFLQPYINKDRDTLAAIKHVMFSHAVEALKN